MNRPLGAALCVALAFTLAGCAGQAGKAALHLAPTRADVARAACTAGQAAYDTYVTRRAGGSELVRLGAELGRGLLFGRCDQTAIARASDEDVRQLRRAERMLKRAKDGKAPAAEDVAAAKAEVALRRARAGD